MTLSPLRARAWIGAFIRRKENSLIQLTTLKGLSPHHANEIMYKIMLC